MKELTLPEIKHIEFKILKTFKSFCDENDIRYFLSNGTLLGAIKYKGFIPWDDDVDVIVPRDDYNKLIKLFKDSNEYCLFSFERNPEYRFPFAKLCDMSTRKEEANINNGVELGVDLDIFPLDFWSDDLKKARKEVKYINKNMFCLGLSKIKKADSRNYAKRFVKKIAMMVSCFLGSKRFIVNIIKKSSENSKGRGLYMGCKAWCIYGEKEIIPATAFSDNVDVEFEGESFHAPIGYDIYLRSLYGDYEKDPPIDKQKSHHKYSAYIM